MLLNPKNTFEAQLDKLKINIDDTEPTKYFICEDWNCTRTKDPVSVGIYYDNKKCECGSLLNREISLSSSCTNNVGPDQSVFTAETASFILTDDLQIMPNWVEFGLQILINFGINGTYGIEEKTVIFGYKEVMDLLKGSLISRTPLTDLIFQKTQKAPLSTAKDSEFSSLIGKNATTSTSEKITVKAIVQKSSGEILLAQSSGDFVDFLFSFLTISLGGVLSLLGGDSSFGSIHNLHTSLASLNSDRYLKIQNPFNTTYIPNRSLSKYQILPVIEQSSPYCCSNWNPFNGNHRAYLSTNKPSALSGYGKVHTVILKGPKDQESYVKLPGMFAVLDDLTVKPTSAIFGLSILNSLKIPTHDIEEHVIDIGMEEALRILNASLFSKSALNDSLKYLLRRQPKEEK